MLSLVGAIIVIASVVGGYLFEGGHLDVLIQPAELIIIAGAAGGSLIISCTPALIKSIIQQLLGILKGNGPGKDAYMELLNLLFELTKTAKANPLSIEAHVDNPESSEIFKKYPGVLSNHHAMDFICDTMKVQLSGSMSPYDLEDLMESDIAALHDEEMKVPAMMAKTGDAMPGLGIVAAV
ncbi:MAG: flagellar motor stator protein MotA, partial [Deltaproteobacteria bacterium]|nr:flagellar motor stator protein MotA [Deltaproteobacteria bacterium]